MASNAAASSGAVEPRRAFGKYISCGYSGNEMPPHLGNRLDLDFSMLKNDRSETVVKVDPVLEQIERNRRIAELLSPVLKYKEMMRKCRSRAAPRRKFSIAQSYPRVNRWKTTAQSRGSTLLRRATTPWTGNELLSNKKFLSREEVKHSPMRCH